MRLLKWLFQPAYLLLIIVIVALYVNRETVFPEEVAESLEAEALVAKLEDMTAGLREDVAEALESTESVEEAVVATTTEQPAVVEEKVVEQQAPAATAEPVETGKAEETVPVEATVVPVEDGVAEPEPESEPLEAVADITAEVSQAAEAAPVVSETAADIAAAPAPLALWQQARAAVWQGELESAVSLYRELIAAQPDNYDAYGEMGNVLLAQSKTEAAAEAYATAARLIYRSGNREIAYRVADIVLRLDQGQAEGLRREFTR